MFGERVALFANAARTSAPNFGYLDENGKELTRFLAYGPDGIRLPGKPGGQGVVLRFLV